MKRGTCAGVGGGIVLGSLAVVAAVAVLVVAVLVNLVANPVQRVGLRLFPPGTSVPVSELRPDGPPARGYPLNVASSTSLDALRRTVLDGRQCPVPPRYERRGCPAEVRPALG